MWRSCNLRSESSVSCRNITKDNRCNIWISYCSCWKSKTDSKSVPAELDTLFQTSVNFNRASWETTYSMLEKMKITTKIKSCLWENDPLQCKHNKIVIMRRYFRAIAFMYCAHAVPHSKHNSGNKGDSCIIHVPSTHPPPCCFHWLRWNHSVSLTLAHIGAVFQKELTIPPC